MFELVDAEQSAVAVCEVNGDQGREVCGDMAVQVGADDTNTITEGEGHGAQRTVALATGPGTLLCGCPVLAQHSETAVSS